MKNSIIFLTLFSGLILTACDRPAADKTKETVIVPVPTAPMVVPMPVPGPAGAPGPAGKSGDKGDPGKTGGDTVIIVPPAEPTKPEVVQPAN